MSGAIFGGFSSLLKSAGIAFGLYKNVQANNATINHDNLVRDDQNKTDAIEGESDALKQVDSVNTAIDNGGVQYADDPLNRNR